MQSDPALSDLSDEEIASKLAGEAVQGPRTFRGKILAPYTRGAKDLVLKVLSRNDSIAFHDCVVCYILSELHAEKPEDRLAKRQALIRATDDPDGFRAAVSIEVLDALSDEEAQEARRTVDAILTPVQLAQVAIAGPKKKARKAARPTTGAS